MKMKRLLAICPTYFPMMGGAERTVDELYNRLANKGYTIDLVTPNLGGKKIEKLGKFNIYRVGKQTKKRPLKFILYQLYTYQKVKKLIKKHNYDLINISYGFPNYFVTNWLRKKKIPIVITEFHLGTGMDIIDEKQNPFFVNPMLNRIYNIADEITVISNEQKRFVKKISGRKSKVIFQGTDEKVFTPNNKSNNLKKKYKINGPMLLTVSRLNKRKNISDQLLALKLVTQKFPNTKLLIVGKGGEEQKLKLITKRLKLKDNVIFTGFVSEKELPKLYATADIFLLTSKLEGFGIANCEALASGTPVVTYDTMAAGDFIINGKTGFITNHNYKTFANRILKLLNDKKMLITMSKNARKETEKKYTWDKYTEKNKEVFDKCIRKKK